MKWTGKPFFGDPQGHAASATEAFRTVSETEFSEVRFKVWWAESPGDKHNDQPPDWEGGRVDDMAGIEKEIKKVAKGSSGKKHKKSGGSKKSGSGVEKAAKKLLK